MQRKREREDESIQGECTTRESQKEKIQESMFFFNNEILKIKNIE